MEHRDLVVVGASVGGLEALCKLVSTFPEQLEASVCLVLHTHNDGPGLLADIIGRFTPLPVSYGKDGDALRPHHIYVAPADHHMLVTPERSLRLNRAPKVNHFRPAIDPLFRSAAEAFDRRAVGVMLTGPDHDGARGLRAIVHAGGIGIVQDPEGPATPSMPLNALFGDHPQHRAPLAEIGPLLGLLIATPLEG
ncbi:MAG: chemotaxis protein CheB [Caulobacteraceae bacterium]